MKPLGQRLLEAKNFDFYLTLWTSADAYLTVPCHRCVLMTWSPYLRKRIEEGGYLLSMSIALDSRFWKPFVTLLYDYYLERESAAATEFELVVTLGLDPVIQKKHRKVEKNLRSSTKRLRSGKTWT